MCVCVCVCARARARACVRVCPLLVRLLKTVVVINFAECEPLEHSLFLFSKHK